MTTPPPDDIDALVDWQLEQGRRSGESHPSGSMDQTALTMQPDQLRAAADRMLRRSAEFVDESPESE
ncbi:hypothetical protein [Nocardia wallacei]|uniref:hypothetical protein n=1 Tax=Nocardia wallacei TaxID=480035 RepID=UPI00245494F3|nr:hypothetical protein [Nocardia wallacei]